VYGCERLPNVKISCLIIITYFLDEQDDSGSCCSSSGKFSVVLFNK
jgi:hypothetical protein